MSRYMWRKCKQRSKKRARLDSSHREESRKVPLTPAERAKAYRERKRLRALDQLNRRIRLTDDLVGDFCMVNVTVNKETKFILGAVHIHPIVLQEAIEYFMIQMLGAYYEPIGLIFSNMNPDTETPILLCRDFNMDIMQNK
jgi:hypothetical protein